MLVWCRMTRRPFSLWHNRPNAWERVKLPMTPTSPIDVSERIELLDILRGFALLGMLIIHMNDFTNDDHAIAGNITDFLLANKALSIFSMLFGMGFAVQMLRMKATGRPFVGLYARRMIVLFIFGAANWCLVLGKGDVLHYYAIYGLVLLLFSRVSARTAVILAMCYLILNVWRAPIVQAINSALDAPARRAAALKKNGGVTVTKQLEQALKTGTYPEFVKLQARQLRNFETDPAIWAGDIVVPAYYFPMFLLGFAAVKCGLITAIRERRKLIQGLMWSALALGIFSHPLPYLNLNLAVPQWTSRLSFLLSGPSLGIFYSCAFALMLESESMRRILRPLRWPGRMGLTNYIAHYAIVLFIYCGFGLGLMKRVNTFQAWGLAAVVFALIWTWSYLWLRRFPYGPLEWLWRTLTYGKPQTQLTAPVPSTNPGV